MSHSDGDLNFIRDNNNYSITDTNKISDDAFGLNMGDKNAVLTYPINGQTYSVFKLHPLDDEIYTLNSVDFDSDFINNTRAILLHAEKCITDGPMIQVFQNLVFLKYHPMSTDESVEETTLNFDVCTYYLKDILIELEKNEPFITLRNGECITFEEVVFKLEEIRTEICNMGIYSRSWECFFINKSLKTKLSEVLATKKEILKFVAFLLGIVILDDTVSYNLYEEFSFSDEYSCPYLIPNKYIYSNYRLMCTRIESFNNDSFYVLIPFGLRTRLAVYKFYKDIMQLLDTSYNNILYQ